MATILKLIYSLIIQLEIFYTQKAEYQMDNINQQELCFLAAQQLFERKLSKALTSSKLLDRNETRTWSVSHVGRLTRKESCQYLKAFQKTCI